MITAEDKQQQREDVNSFIQGNVNPVLIISYELFRKHAEALKALEPALFICDEGHRLKNSAGNKTIAALKSIACRKRIILTGTAVQNDLSEFFSMCEFVNGGILGSLAQFRSTFETPITRSRDKSASARDKEIGEERSKQLALFIQSFVLRRNADVLMKYLPSKTETVIFCKSTPLQQQLYKAIVKSKALKWIIQNADGAHALTCINSLKKVANHPALVYEECKQKMNVNDSELAQAFHVFPANFDPSAPNIELSSKLVILQH